MHVKPAKKMSNTGRVLEQSVVPALTSGGYTIIPQALIGLRFTGLTHKVDILATSPCGFSFPISLKWQQVGGTAEQKVPFEVICLKEAVSHSEGRYPYAYLVLAGPGWTLKDFYFSDAFDQYMPHRDTVLLIGLEDFMALANSGSL